MKRNNVFGVVLFCFVMFSSAWADIDICDLDFKIADVFEYKKVSMIPELLDYVAENESQVRQGICSDSRKMKGLTSKVAKLYVKRYKEGRHDPYVYARYLSFSGVEVKGRVLTVEDNAFLNVILEYLIAKYDSYYAYCKKNMLNGNGERTGNLHEYVYENFFNVGAIVDLTSMVVRGPKAVASDLAYEFAYLWVRRDNPFSQDSFYDFDYTWLVDGRENFLDRYPNSRYRNALKKLVNEDLAKDLRDYDKHDSKLGLMFGVGVGKTWLSSAFEDFDESVTIAFPTARIQIFKVILQLQPDILMCSSSAGLTGADFMLGYAFEWDDYTLDLLGGIGFMQSTFDGIDTSEHVAYMGGVQIFKFFSLGDVLQVAPRIQWVFKAVDYYDPIRHRRRWGVSNGINFAFVIGAVQPLSRLNVLN